MTVQNWFSHEAEPAPQTLGRRSLGALRRAVIFGVAALLIITSLSVAGFGEDRTLSPSLPRLPGWVGASPLADAVGADQRLIARLADPSR